LGAGVHLGFHVKRGLSRAVSETRQTHGPYVTGGEPAAGHPKARTRLEALGIETVDVQERRVDGLLAARDGQEGKKDGRERTHGLARP